MKTLVRLLRTPGVPTVREQVEKLRSPAGRSDVSMRWIGGRRVALWSMPPDRTTEQVSGDAGSDLAEFLELC